jgi:hypothetical protein
MTRACPKCNQANPAEAVFCLNCASPLGMAPHVGQQNFAATQPASQKGLYSLILAAVALLCCGPFAGLPAVILGWLELEAIKSGRSAAGNKWMALVGIWGGIASAAIHIVGYVLWVLMGMLSAASDPYYY